MARAPTVLAWLAVAACTRGGPVPGDDGRPETSDSSTPPGEGDDGGVARERDCEDGEDDDGDGDVDCEDEDCQERHAPCAWPDRLSHELLAEFAGRTVTCETWLGDFDQDVADCVTQYRATLVEETDDPCPACDRSFSGTLEYVADTCTEQFGDEAPPTFGAFGLVFRSDDVWELWGRTGPGQWERGVDLTRAGGWFAYRGTEPVSFDTGGCDNDPLHVGDLTSSLRFQPR